MDLISRKIYLGYPTAVFKDKEDIEFEIRNEIAVNFDIPFTSVQIVGSAKTGYSFPNKREFKEGESDLDVAIISSRLFINFLDYAYKDTDGYSDLTRFYKNDNYAHLMETVSIGYINPIDLPRGELKTQWFTFFRKLSESYIDFFKNINGGVYATQYLFEMKQYQAIEKYLKDKEV